MKPKIVSYTLGTLPPLTKKQQDHLDELAAMPDNQIDTSDIPELTNKQLAEMKPARFYRPIKQ